MHNTYANALVFLLFYWYFTIIIFIPSLHQGKLRHVLQYALLNSKSKCYELLRHFILNIPLIPAQFFDPVEIEHLYNLQILMVQNHYLKKIEIGRTSSVLFETLQLPGVLTAEMTVTS